MHKQLARIVGIVFFLGLLAPSSWAAIPAWQPLAETIYKSEHDLRKYQAIKLSNGMTVLLVSDTQAPKSLAALALPVGSLEDPDNQLGLAHYLEHMVLMGSKHFPEPGSFSEFLKKHGGAIMRARLLTEPLSILKLKIMHWHLRLSGWRMPLLNPC